MVPGNHRSGTAGQSDGPWARVTAVDQAGRNFIADIGPGDLWLFPAGIPHTTQGLEGGCEFLLLFDDGNFSDSKTLSLSDCFAHTSKDVLPANFGVPELVFGNIPSGQVYIYQSETPLSLECQEATGRRYTERRPRPASGGRGPISPGDTLYKQDIDSIIRNLTPNIN